MARLPIELDEETFTQLRERARQERRPVDW
jgi:hypothetical protein